MKLKVVIRLVHTALTPAIRLKWRMYRSSFHSARGQTGSVGLEASCRKEGVACRLGCFQVRSKGMLTCLLHEPFKPSAHSGARTVQPTVKYDVVILGY